MKVKIENNSETQNIPFCAPERQVLRSLLVLIIINLSNDIKSVVKLFADDVKLLVRPLSKETTQMYLN